MHIYKNLLFVTFYILAVFCCSQKLYDYISKTRTYDFKSSVIFLDGSLTIPIKTHANVSIRYLHTDNEAMLAEYTVHKCYRGPCKNLTNTVLYVNLHKGQTLIEVLQLKNNAIANWDFRFSIIYALTVPVLTEVGRREIGIFPNGYCNVMHKRTKDVEYYHEVKSCDFSNIFGNGKSYFQRFSYSSMVTFAQKEKIIGDETFISGNETFTYYTILNPTEKLTAITDFTFNLTNSQTDVIQSYCPFSNNVKNCAKKYNLQSIGTDWKHILGTLKMVNHTWSSYNSDTASMADNNLTDLNNDNQRNIENELKNENTIKIVKYWEDTDKLLEALRNLLVEQYDKKTIHKLSSIFYATNSANDSNVQTLKAAELLVKAMLTKPLIATLLLRAEEQVLVRPNQWGYLYNLIKIQREKDWKFNEFWVTMRNFHVFRPNYLYLAQHGDAFAIRKLLGVINGTSVYITTKYYTANTYGFMLELQTNRVIEELANIVCENKNCSFNSILNQDNINLCVKKVNTVSSTKSFKMPLQSGSVLHWRTIQKLQIRLHYDEDNIGINFIYEISDNVSAIKNISHKNVTVTGEIHLSPKIIVVDKVEMVYPNGYNKSWPGICAGNG